MADLTTAPVLSAADFQMASLYGERAGAPKTLIRLPVTSILALITAAASGYKRYATTTEREAATEPNGTLSYVYANNDDPEDPDNGWWQADDSAPDGWVRASWISNDLIAVVQPLVDEAVAVLSDPDFVAVNAALPEIAAVSAITSEITALAAIDSDISDAVANIDDITTMAAGLTGAELTAIRKANQQVERQRIAALTGRINYFASSLNGSDIQSGTAMSRAKATVAGLVAGYASYGITNIATSGTLTGGTAGTYRPTVSGGSPYRVPVVQVRIASGGAVEAGQNGWTRAIDPGDYAAGSAVPTLTMPAAANMGGLVLTATLGQVLKPGEVAGFECGSRFTEQYVVRTMGVTVTSFFKGGKARLPLFDCTDPVAAWTLDSGNVWTATIGRASDYETVGGEDNYSLWQDTSPTTDMGANYRWMTRVTSKALCENTPDSYYIPVASVYAEASATTPVYVHAAGSVDPNTLKYRYNRRTQGVFGKDRLPNLTVEGISCIGPLSAQGSVNAGTNFTFRRACLANGGKHDVVFESGLVEDVVTWNTELISNRGNAQPGGGLDCIQFTSYRADPTGLSTTLRRCMSIQPSGVDNGGWFYSHASGAGIYDEILLEGCCSNNRGNVKGVYAKRQLFRGMYQAGLRGAAATPTAMIAAMTADPALVMVYEQTHCLLTADATVGSGSQAAALTSGINSGSETWIADRSDVTIKHNGYYNAHDQVLGQSWANLVTSVSQKLDFSYNTAYLTGRYSFISATNPLTAGSAGIRRNIMIRNFANIGSTILWVTVGASFTGTFDYNVYIDLQANANLRWRKGSTNYTWANWQALGLDTHSVVLNAAQADDLFLNGIAGLANGDFRLDPACTLQFTDGSLIVGNAGIQEYYDHNARQYVTGQPKRWPVIPASWAECQAYAYDPAGWNFYP